MSDEKKFKILSFEPTPEIEKQIGIVQVLLSDLWIANFKVVAKDDGTYFIAPPTIKGSTGEDGKVRWRDGIAPDSTTLRQDLYASLRDFVKQQQAAGEVTPF